MFLRLSGEVIPLLELGSIVRPFLSGDLRWVTSYIDLIIASSTLVLISSTLPLRLSVRRIVSSVSINFSSSVESSKFCWFRRETCLFSASASHLSSYWSPPRPPLTALKCSISPLRAETSSSLSFYVILRSFSRLASSLPLKNSWSFILVRAPWVCMCLWLTCS